MKTTIPAAAAAALAALVLAGCQAGGSTSAAVSASTSASASPTSATHSGPASAASATVPASRPASGAAPGPPRCHTAGLAVTLGAPRGPAGGQQTMSLTFTNTSAAACSMFGFPGVSLVAGGGIQWALERQSQPPRRIMLPPGGHSRSTLTLLRWEAGDGTSFAPARAFVTPPDETTYRTLAWPPGVILVRQDEATHPGTFIGPVG